MNQVIKFGILSFAHYHANFWADAINQSPHAELVGVWDDNPSRGKEAAGRYQTAFFSELSALLRGCDAVGITSETAKHADLVEKAAGARTHILLEKPMAANLADCARIRGAVDDAGVVFMQNFPKRYDPINQELVSRVRGGDLGKIFLVRIRHGNYHLLELGEAASSQWYGQPALSGGGALIDEGIHAADFLLWLLGEPEAAFALTSKATLGLPLEDTAVALFTYPNGVLAEISTSNTLVAAQESIEIYGTQGSALLSGVDLASKDLTQAPYLKYYFKGEQRGGWEGSPTVPAFQKPDFHHGGLRYFIECLRSGAAPVVSLDEGWKSLAMVLASYQAAATGEMQKLDFSLDRLKGRDR